MLLLLLLLLSSLTDTTPVPHNVCDGGPASPYCVHTYVDLMLESCLCDCLLVAIWCGAVPIDTEPMLLCHYLSLLRLIVLFPVTCSPSSLSSSSLLPSLSLLSVAVLTVDCCVCVPCVCLRVSGVFDMDMRMTTTNNRTSVSSMCDHIMHTQPPELAPSGRTVCFPTGSGTIFPCGAERACLSSNAQRSVR